MKAPELSTSPSRRQVLQLGAGASLAALASQSVLAQDAPAQKGSKQDQLKVGLIGCGGRGTGAARQALNADPNTVLWAIGDAFAEPLEQVEKNLEPLKDRLQFQEGRAFSGLDAFQKVIDSGVDVVLLTTPPAFRPAQLRAAVEAGKHVFAEKPMAVDMKGVHSIIESAKIAKEKNLSLQHGYCWRFHPPTRQAFEKILAGDFGPLRSMYSVYYSVPGKPLPVDASKPAGMGETEWQLRWWFNYLWLSSGPLVEQCIHNVDRVAWVNNDATPVAAVGNGGRIQREDKGNIYDHYNVAYQYDNGVFCHVGQRHFLNSYQAVQDQINLEGGVVVAPGRCYATDHAGKRIWRPEATPGTQDMYQLEHNELFAAIRSGKPINKGEYAAHSTALGILGREAAHTGRRLTWQDLWKSNQQLVPDEITLNGEAPKPDLPIPGKYKFA